MFRIPRGDTEYNYLEVGMSEEIMRCQVCGKECVGKKAIDNHYKKTRHRDWDMIYREEDDAADEEGRENQEKNDRAIRQEER